MALTAARSSRSGLQVDAIPSQLAGRIVDVIARVPPNLEPLAVARNRVEAASAEVMSNKARGSHGIAARMVVALAHISQAAGWGTAASVIADSDREFRQFAAFRKNSNRQPKPRRTQRRRGDIHWGLSTGSQQGSRNGEGGCVVC